MSLQARHPEEVGLHLQEAPATLAFPLVAIGASAGGLEACKTLVQAMPSITGMAFVLVQHLDPHHESMMVDLLAGRSALTIVQAVDGMRLEREHLYTIPPDSFLAIESGTLRLSRPSQRHGTRLPFDFFLNALAPESGARAMVVVLSGTGRDGSLGIAAIKAAGGYCIAQDPDEADYDGMPRGAIATGLVDMVLRARDIPAALLLHATTVVNARQQPFGPKNQNVAASALDAVVELVRIRTSADFSTYKKGTLQRRIERRLALANNGSSNMDRYLDLLRADPAELDLLAKDLLIHTTGFFRDREIFARLQESVLPNLMRTCAKTRSLRVWVAGCSTGEEAYSLAMILREWITAEKLDVKLQIFASDIDRDAVVTAREGFYPNSVAADVSAERLSRFFAREDRGYRISAELRAAVVFTIHDVLADPPFSRLDMISCRNLLIYLGPAAQRKLISLFHFALKSGGLLLLGTAETVGRADDIFETLSKPERLYRKLGLARAGDLDFMALNKASTRETVPQQFQEAKPRQAAVADVCRRALLEAYAPASVLINARNECVYHFGPTDDYLRIAPGFANHAILEMAPKGTRSKVKSAIQRARDAKVCITVAGGRASRHRQAVAFDITLVPVENDEDDFLLVSFIDKPKQPWADKPGGSLEDPASIAESERELDVTRSELQGAIRDLEASSEDQKAINEEALSFNEEYQSTNEELVTSKEELQSYNEELTALNSQLQETLEKQRTTSADLQNVLYSTNVATVFLDMDLKIRFFTPATRAIFHVIPSDIGRPLADLRSLASDHEFAADASDVLLTREPREREIQVPLGAWFHRRILPYRGHEGAIEGIVITFTDMTSRKHDAEVLETAKRLAEQATLAKSRFLAAASHDLRQPLQTLSFIRGLLAETATGEGTARLVVGLEETLSSMSAMLDTLLDVNQIEAGIVCPTTNCFPVLDILEPLKDEFAYHAKAHGLALHVVGCSLNVESDKHLLEQMVRNLLSNALKYTSKGKVLLGCRRCGDIVRIEIWDTGAGIPKNDLEAIFVEYHQLDNSARARARARDRGRGLGLGLSIVQSLGKLLGHAVRVRSTPGRGSVFSIDVKRHGKEGGAIRASAPTLDPASLVASHKNCSILLVEDDPEIRQLMVQILTADGHRVCATSDGVGALDSLETGGLMPDIILADYNLPDGMDGLEVASRIQANCGWPIPVVILTGDISTEALRKIAARDCLALNKPIQSDLLLAALQRLLLPRMSMRETVEPPREIPRRRFTLFVVDDDEGVRTWVRGVFEAEGHRVETFADGESFLAAYRPGCEECVLIDAGLPGMSGTTLLAALREAGWSLPAIMITGRSDVAMAVAAMKAGASDFIEKPASTNDLAASVGRAIERARDDNERLSWQTEAAGRLATLTQRQRQVLTLVLAGSASKAIAYELSISQRTVENHRASIMRKTGVTSLPALARLALAADLA